ncbi:hypothetical protein ACJ72_01229 [Emergomyces africanus]|uniref:Mitotic checkpoint regulator, MAD2B-interacting-domain-containing protein n=1 Tax=Emergomyces africanus TaxID=1955775 RepID=A0A1B7P671_9EURO|nr:hypothetical protein ACJ72_01229 [Emergomyces africanus]
MALVSYSDSEGSDSESTPAPQIFEKKKGASPGAITPTHGQSKPSKPTFQPLTDRKNPRKIFVSLPDTTDKPTESDTLGHDSDNNDDGDGPRKRPRIGAQGGGTFSGFNSLLPAPKRKGPVKPGSDNKSDGTAAPARKVFSLKTGAEPAFDRRADAQMKWNLGNGADSGTMEEEDRGGADVGFGSRGSDGIGDGITASVKEKVEGPGVKPKGNAMMFKPLSVARSSTKQRKARTTVGPPPQAMEGDAGLPHASGVPKASATGGNKAKEDGSNPAPKPKVSLFGLGKEDRQAPSISQASSTTYVPLVYNIPSEPEPHSVPPMESLAPLPSAFSSLDQPHQQQQTLATIADDLNLTPAEKRQLFGRQGFSSSSSNAPGAKQSNPNIITFNTDQEYSSNNAFLLSASDAELAAQQHNPVRSIAPGKHSLQQLVNAVSNQREALEESFAIGKRNKKEAGNKYGW